MFDLGSHSDYKDVLIMYESSLMVKPTITSILLSSGWFRCNVKNRCLYHEVYADQLCGGSVTGLKNVTLEFSISRCYFEVDIGINENFIII